MLQLNKKERSTGEETPGLERAKVRAELIEEFGNVFQQVADASDDAEDGHEIRRNRSWEIGM